MESNSQQGNLDALVGTFIAGYLGYTAGSRRFVGWEPIIKNYDMRMGYLAYMKVIRPVSFLDAVPVANILYREALLAYLFGLPDSSIPTTLRCLEVGLGFKHTTATQLPLSEKSSLYDLIEWAEGYLGKRKETAHGFRLLRNLIHGQSVMAEQDALEAIRHVTDMLNLLYPVTAYTTVTYPCQLCGKQSQQNWPTQECYLGHVLNTYCASCKQLTTVLVI